VQVVGAANVQGALEVTETAAINVGDTFDVVTAASVTHGVSILRRQGANEGIGFDAFTANISGGRQALRLEAVDAIEWSGPGSDLLTPNNWESSTLPGAGDHAYLGPPLTGSNTEIVISAGGSFSVETVTLDERLLKLLDGSLIQSRAVSILKNSTLQCEECELEAYVLNEGKIGIGQSPGQMVVTGDYLQVDGGRLNIEIGGTMPGDDFDLLEVTGIATFEVGAVIDISNINGFLPALGQTFDVVTANEIFVSGLVLSAPEFNGLTYSAQVVSRDGGQTLQFTATIIPVPEPGTAVLALLPICMLHCRGRRIARKSCSAPSP